MLPSKQVRVDAEDSGHPPKMAETIVLISVRRNLMPPQFDGNGIYDRTIDVDTAVNNTPIVTVHARDADIVVSSIKIPFLFLCLL